MRIFYGEEIILVLICCIICIELGWNDCISFYGMITVYNILVRFEFQQLAIYDLAK